jgi:hypothetical protein
MVRYKVARHEPEAAVDAFMSASRGALGLTGADWRHDGTASKKI